MIDPDAVYTLSVLVMFVALCCVLGTAFEVAHLRRDVQDLIGEVRKSRLPTGMPPADGDGPPAPGFYEKRR